MKLACQCKKNHGVADVGWQAEAPHGRPAALVPVLDHLEHLGRQPAEDAVVPAPGLMMLP